MIVDPDFADHWKTRMLVDSLDDEAAPVYLIRLWGHCQNRRTSSFESLPTAALKALCRYPGHPNKLESALAASGFVRREGTTLLVCGWDEYNATLIANWANGKKGGRPRKIPTDNPAETHGIPTANPNSKSGNPSETDKSRVDEIREEVIDTQPRANETPTLDQVKAFARSAPMAITEACAIAFHETQESVGWIDKHQRPIVLWRPALQRYASNWNENEKSKSNSSQKGRPAASHRAGEFKETTMNLPTL